MLFIYFLYLVGFAGLSLSFPIQSRSLDVAVPNSSTDTVSAPSNTTAPVLDLADLNDNAATTTRKPTSAQVKNAVSSFANDANTVSSSLNALPSTTNTKMIKSLATTAFNAESDEDQHRAVLAAASGTAGKTPNAMIMKFTPTVLTGLKAIMNNPSAASVSKNVATISKARNPNILPSITQLSNSALDSMGLAETAQKFPATNAAN